MDIDKGRGVIADFYKAHKRMPSYGELAKLLGYRSKSAVYYFVQKLISLGVVGNDKGGRLIPGSIREIRVLGLVEAGFPTSAAEEILDTMSLDEFLVENREASYLLE